MKLSLAEFRSLMQAAETNATTLGQLRLSNERYRLEIIQLENEVAVRNRELDEMRTRWHAPGECLAN
jgi:hypothetical protein